MTLMVRLAASGYGSMLRSLWISVKRLVYDLSTGLSVKTKQEKADTNVFPRLMDVKPLSETPGGGKGLGGPSMEYRCVHRVSIKSVYASVRVCVSCVRVCCFPPRSGAVRVAGLAPSPTVTRPGQIPHGGER